MGHVIRLTKLFSFEAAHALEGYDGACREIHGHSYKLYVTVKGEPVADERDPKFGMVMDFGDLKRIVNEQVVKPFDHAFVLRRTESNSGLYEQLRDRFERIVLLEFQPTCENMLAPPHPAQPARTGEAACAPAARNGDLLRRVVRRGQLTEHDKRERVGGRSDDSAAPGPLVND